MSDEQQGVPAVHSKQPTYQGPVTPPAPEPEPGPPRLPPYRGPLPRGVDRVQASPGILLRCRGCSKPIEPVGENGGGGDWYFRSPPDSYHEGCFGAVMQQRAADDRGQPGRVATYGALRPGSFTEGAQ